MHVEIVNAGTAEQNLPDLITLLISIVDDGSSIGWLPPMQPTAAESYWRERFAAVERGECVLLLAFDDERVVGTAQLELAQRENGSHRAEVQKVLVHLEHRRRGIGRQLMQTLEVCARQQGRSLLVLDTREGDTAEQLYQRMGYERVGVIPMFARSASGQLDGTVIYYKVLELNR